MKRLAIVTAAFLAGCGGLVGADFSGLEPAPSLDAGAPDASVVAPPIDAGDGSHDSSDSADAGFADAADSADVITIDAPDAGGPDAADPAGLPPGWTVLYPSAADVAVGASDDVLWILGGAATAEDENFPALEWQATTSSFIAVPAVFGTTLDVTPSGPCVVRVDNTIWASPSNGVLTQLVDGIAQDIGAGLAGDIWVVSNTAQPGAGKDKETYEWTGSFTPNPFALQSHSPGDQVDLDADGSAWIVGADGEVKHATFSTSSQSYVSQLIPLDGSAVDIGVGAAGVFAVGHTAGDAGTVPTVFRFSSTTGRFAPYVALDAIRVSVGPSKLVVVLRDGRLASTTVSP